MQALSSAWQRALSAPAASRPTLLVSIAPAAGGKAPVGHPALEPGAITAAVDRDLLNQRGIEVASATRARSVLFAPTLLEWPTITRSLALQEFRASIADVVLRFARSSGAAARLDGSYGRGAYARIDLWAHGIGLDEVIRLAAGPIDGRAVVDDATGVATVTMVDGEPKNSALFPPDKISRAYAAFADAPDDVNEKYAMRVIFGAYPGRVFCPPISRDGRRFFVQTPHAERHPTAVWKDDQLVTGGYRFVDAWADSTPYTELEFDEPISQVLQGARAAVYVTGGVGVTSENPIERIVEVAGFALSKRAAALIRAYGSRFDFAALHGTQASCWEILSRRFAPQAGCAATFEAGEVDLVPLGSDGPVSRVRVGSELLFRIDEGAQYDDDSNVFNYVEFQCGRDQYRSESATGAQGLFTIYRNPEVQSAVQSVQQRSFEAFGYRHTTWELFDLAVERNEAGRVVGCPGGEEVADIVAGILAHVGATRRYRASWLTGMTLGRGDLVSLTDLDSNLSESRMRVVEWSLPATGPEIAVRTEPVG